MWAVAVGAVAIVWKANAIRMDDMQKQIESKAAGAEVERQRDTQAKLFDIMREHEAEDRTRHEQLLEKINDGNSKILDRLSRLK